MLQGMEHAVAVHLPRELVERVDVVAPRADESDESVRWMLSEALQRREPVDSAYPREAS